MLLVEGEMLVTDGLFRGFVISQDSQVRKIANVDESVIFWMHSMV